MLLYNIYQTSHIFFWYFVVYVHGFFLGAFAKLQKATITFVMSVRPHGTTRLPLHEFLWNLTFEYFSKIYRGYSSFTKIWLEWWALNVKTSKYFLIICRAILLRIRHFSGKSCRENQNTPFIFNGPFLKKKILPFVW